jgi:broad specificity phosphatase PhoE
MHVLLLRHGQTDENALGILQGQSQTRLNEAGRRQAHALARRLATYVPRVEALVTSDLARATETADALAASLGLEFVKRDEWRERSFGPFEGRTLGDADIWRAATGHWDLPGAEPTAAFQARVSRALEGVARDFEPVPCVAVVTHGAVLRNILSQLADGQLRLDDAEPAPASVPIVNCAIMHLEARRIDKTVVAWRVRRVNDVDHLTEALQPALRVEE